VTIRYRGMMVLRGLEDTLVTFPNGKSVTVKGMEAVIVSL